jgi:hypothetical protein
MPEKQNHFLSSCWKANDKGKQLALSHMLEIVTNFQSLWQSMHIEFRQNPACRFLTQRRSRYLQLKECGNRTPRWGNCCIAVKLIIVKLTVEVHRDVHQFSWLGQWSVVSLQHMCIENAEWDHVWRQRNRKNKIEEPKQKPQKQRRREHKGNTREDKTPPIIQFWGPIIRGDPTKLEPRWQVTWGQTKLDTWQSDKNNKPRNIQNMYGAQTYIIRRLGASANSVGRPPVNWLLSSNLYSQVSKRLFQTVKAWIHFLLHQ